MRQRRARAPRRPQTRAPSSSTPPSSTPWRHPPPPGASRATAVATGSLAGTDRVRRLGPRVDLAGAIVVPGFIDSHLHLLYGGFMLVRPQLDNASSPADVVKTLQSWLKAHPLPPNAWIGALAGTRTASPHQDYQHAPTSTAPPTTPVAHAIDGHAAWANSAALRAAPPLGDRPGAGGSCATTPQVNRPASSPTRRCRSSAARSAADVWAEGGGVGQGIETLRAERRHVDPRPRHRRERQRCTWARSTTAPSRSASTQCGSAPTPTASARTAPHAVAAENPPRDRFSAEAVKFFLDGALDGWGAAMWNCSDRPHEHPGRCG